jgi:DnaJ-class molecular chaperone
MAKKGSKPASPNADEICELCAGTGKTFLMRSARKGRPDLGSLNCSVCGGTGRIKKQKPK